MTPEQIRDFAANVAPRLNRSESGSSPNGTVEQIMLLAEIGAQLAELNRYLRQSPAERQIEEAMRHIAAEADHD